MGFKVTVNGKIGTDKYLTLLEANGNVIVSDEPEQFGGLNKGLNPFELLAASLSGCTLATLRGYIDRKGWIVPEIFVEVELESFPIERNAVFKRTINFKNAILTDKQKMRLLHIAEKCPVHNVLKGNIDIQSGIL